MNSHRIHPVSRAQNLRRHILAWASALALITLTSCGGGTGSSNANSTVIGPAGGILTGPDGVQVVVPAGALDQPTTIKIARSSAGAPNSLPEDNPPAGGIYEFTPHGLIFNTPVTIRMPVPANVVEPEVFMASLGEDWQENGVTVTGGIAEWQRNSFSWGMISGCQPANLPPYSAANPDPYPCVYPRGATTASATPASAITPIPNLIPTYFSPVADNPVSWIVNGPGTVQLTMRYAAAPDCGNARVKLLRWNPAVPLSTPGRVQTVFEGPVVLASTTYPLPGSPGFTYTRGVGSTTVDVSSYLTDANNSFGFSFSCNRPFRATRSGGEVLTFIGAMPAPSVTYTIGGTVSGLTGSGLVLHNGADNLPVPADGPFTFPTAIAAGASYNVSVQTPPSGQACTVQNGSGTASADVLDVTVSCIAAKAWQGASLIETNDGNPTVAPTIAMDPSGNAMVMWNQTGVYWPDIWANRYVAGAGVGTGWETATLVETDDTGGATSPSVAFDANGNAIAVWEQPSGGRNSIWANRYVVGTGWGMPTLLETDNARDAYYPKIAMDASGNAIAVWSHSDGTRLNIWANRYVAGTGAGTGWGAATLIETDNAGPALYPRVAMDANGNAIAVWAQFDGTRNNVWANRYVAGTGWGTAELIETDNAGYASYPSIAMDASGNGIAVWAQSDGTRYNVWANRYVAGAGWDTAALLESDDSGDADPGPVVMDANGNAMVAWHQFDGINFNIWGKRYVAGTGWGAVTLIATNTAGDTSIPSIAMNASGDAVAVWHQSDGTRTNIWANRYVDGTGWSTASLIENDDTGDAIYPSVVMDASGNAIATWLQSDGTWNNVTANVFK